MQYTLRVKDDDERRVQQLSARTKITRTELIRRLFLVGVSQVEQGVDLFNPGASNRVQTLLTEIHSLLELTRRRPPWRLLQSFLLL